MMSTATGPWGGRGTRREAGGPIAEISTATTTQWPASHVGAIPSIAARPHTASRAFSSPTSTIVTGFLDGGEQKFSPFYM
ncbi:hypothetical protein TIFTF001_026495 [Ficus carica]|uniref:Uncharacterized protein n=1 Tax=Ficus carica TaxID=3494 RepID=A0AA88DLJ4_FICCA|nr:hypothetical protein TIFTF001_026495 [Ficus carica]